MTKIIGFMALHYGVSYISYAIRSVIDHVDEMWILYSAHGSHGTQIAEPCPESREQLYALAHFAAGNKLHWVDGTWGQEGEQREAILKHCPDADVIVVVDSDEIYPTGLVPELIEQTSGWHRRAIRVPFVHFYRDFRHAVIHDPAYPPRIIYPRIKDGEATAQARPIAHMGYCQPSNIIRYKLAIHGHKAELRCSADEYVDTIYRDQARMSDLHPVGSEWWNPEPVNPLDYMPVWMAQHPFFGLEVIP